MLFHFIPAGVFGGPLRDTMKYDQEYYQCEVPHVLKQCVDIIAEDGISVEGIFRYGDWWLRYRKAFITAYFSGDISWT